MKQSQKKKLAVLLITAMLFTLLPAGAFAADTTDTTENAVTLNIADGNITINATGYTVGDTGTPDFTGSYKITGNSTSTSNSIVVTGGKHDITLDNVVINSSGCAFALKGNADVTLTLKETNTLQSGSYAAGIHVPAGTKLTIKGEGTITANGGNYGTGIGGGYKGSTGTIEICGGTVIAKGGYTGAGIGSSWEGTGGTIVISGGTVTATGNSSGAGIGGGNLNRGGVTVIISGGTVTAKGGNNAAGIGSGYSGTPGVIAISGGTVTATGGFRGAGMS